MRRSPTRDLIVGLFVLAGLAAIAYLSLSIGGVSYSGPKGFILYADFDEIGGLKPRAPVVISGVKVGEVDGHRRSTTTTAPASRFNLDPTLKLPIDTIGLDRHLRRARRPLRLAAARRRRAAAQARRRDRVRRVGGHPRAADRQAHPQRRRRRRQEDDEGRRSADPDGDAHDASRSASLALALLAAALRSAAPAASRTTTIRRERFNRKIFWFNDKLDAYALEPVARGWDYVMPDAVQRGISRFFNNLRFPIIFANDLLQGKPRDAAESVARFEINTFFGGARLLRPRRRPRPAGRRTRTSARRSACGASRRGRTWCCRSSGRPARATRSALAGDAALAIYPYFVPIPRVSVAGDRGRHRQRALALLDEVAAGQGGVARLLRLRAQRLRAAPLER